MLIILIVLAVLLVLHFSKGKQANPIKEADAMLDRTKLAILPSQLQQVDEALDAYAAEHSAYPDDLAELVPDCLPQDDLLIDPWGTRLRLEGNGKERMFLVSAGPDRVFGTSDDSRRSL